MYILATLYKVENKFVRYAYSDEELNQILNEIGRDGNYKIQRYKVLVKWMRVNGYNMDPERVLLRVTMNEEESSEIDLTLLLLWR